MVKPEDKVSILFPELSDVVTVNELEVPNDLAFLTPGTRTMILPVAAPDVNKSVTTTWDEVTVHAAAVVVPPVLIPAWHPATAADVSSIVMVDGKSIVTYPFWTTLC